MSSKVSVIIPNYNHARYLAKRIDSVLTQTHQNIEVILLDDCSTDNSRTIINTYVARDKRIRAVYNSRNSGSTFKQWNKGLALAQGKYVWIAESDDYANLDFLSTLVAILDADSAVGLAYCDSISINEQDVVLDEWKIKFWNVLQTRLWMNDFVLPGTELLEHYMPYYNVIPNASAVVLRRSILEEVGPADETTRLTGDWLYWIKILARCSVSYVSKPYNYFRTHANNVRSKTELNGVLLEESSRVLLALKEVIGNSLHIQKAAERIFERWFMGFVYGNIPAHRNFKLFRNMNDLYEDRGVATLDRWKNFLFGGNMRGVKMIIGDKYLYKLFKKRNRSS